jgi:hypothetical protein
MIFLMMLYRKAHTSQLTMNFRNAPRKVDIFQGARNVDPTRSCAHQKPQHENNYWIQRFLSSHIPFYATYLNQLSRFPQDRSIQSNKIDGIIFLRAQDG